MQRVNRRDRTSCSACSAQRTQVIDDAADYFDSNDKWLSQQQRTKLEKLQSQMNAEKKADGKKITIDFAGRRVYNNQDDKIADRL